MAFVLELMNLTITMATPFLLCVIGGVFSDRCGVVNFTYEGIMTFGAFSAILFARLTGNVLFGCAMAIVVCLAVKMVFASFVLDFHGNAVFVGLAINLIASSVVPFLLQALFGKSGSLIATDLIDPAKMIIHVPLLEKIPIIGAILNDHTPLTYLSFVLVALMTVVLYKTRFGMYVRVCGENEEAAEALGIRVKAIRYKALAISAVFCALAGINLAVENLGMYTDSMVAGRGFICLSAIMCGRGKPVRSTMFGLLFGFAKALQIRITSFVSATTASLIGILPYVAMLVTLVITEYPKVMKNPERIERV